MRGATILCAALSARHCLVFSKLPPTSRAVVTPAARYRLRSYWIGIGPTRSSCQCMCVFTMPGMTYLPVASMIASASGHLPLVLLPILAISPFSRRMSFGPYAGTPVPGMIIALLMSRR